MVSIIIVLLEELVEPKFIAKCWLVAKKWDNIKYNFCLSYIKMGKEIIKFNKTEVEKHKFHH